MPYKIDKIKIAGTKYDGRVKLTQDQRNAVKVLILQGGYSQRRVAAMFGVSRRLVQSILNPPIRRIIQNTHTSEYWRVVKQRHRLKKKALFTSNKIH